MEDIGVVIPGGILAVLVIKLVLDFIAKREAKTKPARDVCKMDAELRGKLHEVHEWHDHDEHDPGAAPGEKVWWNTSLKRDMRSLAESVETLATNVSGQTEALEGLTTCIKEMKG